MHNSTAEAVEFVHRFRQALAPDVSVEILLIPPFTALYGIRQMLHPDDPFRLGAQDLYWEEEGAYTGEISGRMLKDVGCQSVIIGHSERRRLLAETDTQVNKKLKEPHCSMISLPSFAWGKPWRNDKPVIRKTWSKNKCSRLYATCLPNR